MLNSLLILSFHCSTKFSQIEYLKSKLAKFMDNRSVSVDSNLHEDLSIIMEEQNVHICKNYKPGTFQRVFWEQQISASKLKSSPSMRWDLLNCYPLVLILKTPF